MKRQLTITAAAALLAATLAALAVAASSNAERRLTIGARLAFASNGSATGSFSACCAISDKGVAEGQVTSFTQSGDVGRFTATNTFHGSDGTIEISLDGSTGPLSGGVHLAEGTWLVVSGTGAYAGMRGHGKFTAVTNEVTGELTGIDEGVVKLGS